MIRLQGTLEEHIHKHSCVYPIRWSHINKCPLMQLVSDTVQWEMAHIGTGGGRGGSVFRLTVHVASADAAALIINERGSTRA